MVREQGGRTAQFIVESIRSGKFTLGYTPRTATRFVQFELPPGIPSYSSPIRRTQAIQLERVPLPHGGSSLILLLQEPVLADVFSLFVDDLLQHLVIAQTPEQAVSAFYTRFEHWQQMFARVASDMIGMERQRGLFGELTILQQLLDRHADAPEAWDCWRGPLSANHDFSKAGTAMEVKTSIASLPVMHISNEVQLDLTGWSHLVLCLVHLNEVRGGSHTLSTLIGKLIQRSSTRPAIQAAFQSKLLKVGVDPRHFDLFSEQGYEVRAISCYRVTQDFPAIRRSGLSSTIGKVTYELHPAGCVPYGMELDNALGLFRS
ncbi:MAG: PD-(D/E)XK motif protein [Flavobacteriales bacterium]|nr:PD-(D/E)XK motif protein [Flavobacteriales bacterium]